MKTIWFHMQGYRDLPDDFRDRYESIWVTPPNDELCHSPEVAKYLHWNLDELEMADDLGFDGLGLNEHHQNGYGFPISPNMIATVLARRKSNAALVVLGNTLPLYNPPIRVAEEFALLDCLSGGRLVAGFPVGSPMDTTGSNAGAAAILRGARSDQAGVDAAGAVCVQRTIHQVALRQPVAEAAAETASAYLARGRRLG